MKTDLKITLIQADLSWEDKEKNLSRFEELIGHVKETDLIILPEMFTTGFSMRTELLAEEMNDTTLSWLRKQSREKNAVICGSVIIKDDSEYYNRLIWMNPDGSFQYYDKRHLFRMGEEHLHFSAGKKKIFPEVKGWRICPLICYDLRFPVWSRNVAPYFDLQIFVANWPEVRRNAWRTLLQARAIENQCYIAGVNRVGKDGRGIDHSGDSMVVDARGNILMDFLKNEEKTETIQLSFSELEKFRESFPVLSDADEFRVEY